MCDNHCLDKKKKKKKKKQNNKSSHASNPPTVSGSILTLYQVDKLNTFSVLPPNLGFLWKQFLVNKLIVIHDIFTIQKYVNILMLDVLV